MDRFYLSQISVDEAADILATRRAASAQVGGFVKESDLKEMLARIKDPVGQAWGDIMKAAPNLAAAQSGKMNDGTAYSMNDYWTDTGKEAIRNALIGGGLGAGIGGLKGLISGDGFFGNMLTGGLAGAGIGGAGTGLYRGGAALLGKSPTEIQSDEKAKAEQAKEESNTQRLIDNPNQAGPGEVVDQLSQNILGVRPSELNPLGGDGPPSQNAQLAATIFKPGTGSRLLANLTEPNPNATPQDLIVDPATGQKNIGTLEGGAAGLLTGAAGGKFLDRMQLLRDMRKVDGSQSSLQAAMNQQDRDAHAANLRERQTDPTAAGARQQAALLQQNLRKIERRQQKMRRQAEAAHQQKYQGQKKAPKFKWEPDVQVTHQIDDLKRLIQEQEAIRTEREGHIKSQLKPQTAAPGDLQTRPGSTTAGRKILGVEMPQNLNQPFQPKPATSNSRIGRGLTHTGNTLRQLYHGATGRAKGMFAPMTYSHYTPQGMDQTTFKEKAKATRPQRKWGRRGAALGTILGAWYGSQPGEATKPPTTTWAQP